jgi:hypothetical protein
MARLLDLSDLISCLIQLLLGIQPSMSLRMQAAECSRWREPAVCLAMVFEPAELATE